MYHILIILSFAFHCGEIIHRSTCHAEVSGVALVVGVEIQVIIVFGNPTWSYFIHYR